MDQATIRPAIELLVSSVRESSYSLDEEAALLIREYGLNLGQNDPSIQARIALAQLDAALSDRYSFTLPSLDGQSTSLKDLRGKVVLLNFWATWCGPCRAEKPILQKVYGDLKEKGFMLLAITDEDPAIVRRFVNEIPYRFAGSDRPNASGFRSLHGRRHAENDHSQPSRAGRGAADYDFGRRRSCGRCWLPPEVTP